MIVLISDWFLWNCFRVSVAFLGLRDAKINDVLYGSLLACSCYGHSLVANVDYENENITDRYMCVTWILIFFPFLRMPLSPSGFKHLINSTKAIFTGIEK